MILQALIVLLVPGAAPCDQGKRCAHLEGSVERGDRYQQPFGPGLTISLEPIERGWTIVVRDAGPDENIARLTPPWHFVPNPRDIEGWHFRNASNTAPNDGGVNAPQQEREFLFSPEVGRSLEYPPTSDLEDLLSGNAGKGLLTIRNLTLGNLIAGEKAWIQRMEFTIDLITRCST